MRIIGGSARGRRIKSPPGRLRPTSDRVREALFSILQSLVPGADFLDLYAGSGAVGLEALSRGASRAVFVEENRRRARAIQELLDELGWSDRARVHGLKVLRYLDRHGESFDIVFVDPPYHTGELGKFLAALRPARLVRPGGALVIEHPTDRPPRSPLPGGFTARSYRYGDTTLSVLRRGAAADETAPDPAE